jgi:two-component system, NarL family, sensor histidine kinase DesK
VTEVRKQSFAGTGLGLLGRPALSSASAEAAPLRNPWRRIRILFSAVWLIYLGQPLATLPGHHHAWWVAGAVTVTVAFCAVFLAVITGWDKYPVLARWGLAALVLLAGAFTLIFHGEKAGGNVVWIFVSSVSGWAVPNQRAALRAVAGIAACYLFFSWLGHEGLGNTLITLIPVVFVGITMASIRNQLKLGWELRQAREEVARLAATEERLRLARDMHDLTGQSLSMITLKSELAARLLRRLPESTDRDRVLDEITEVAAVSRQTLHDIREAISGYRRPTLAVEIITARAALDSAGIAVHDEAGLTLLSGTFDPEAEAALAWCLREAVTNVVRHSEAGNCCITLTRRGRTLVLEVRDDGKGFPAVHPLAGNGLRGMSERLSAVGGSLELRPDASPGFRLIATAPQTVLQTAPQTVLQTVSQTVPQTVPETASAAVPETVPVTMRAPGPARVTVTE